MQSDFTFYQHILKFSLIFVIPKITEPLLVSRTPVLSPWLAWRLRKGLPGCLDHRLIMFAELHFFPCNRTSLVLSSSRVSLHTVILTLRKLSSGFGVDNTYRHMASYAHRRNQVFRPQRGRSVQRILAEEGRWISQNGKAPQAGCGSAIGKLTGPTSAGTLASTRMPARDSPAQSTKTRRKSLGNNNTTSCGSKRYRRSLSHGRPNRREWAICVPSRQCRAPGGHLARRDPDSGDGEISPQDC